ncbi:MAG TPA: PilZ domain-containing protein [Candidatus Polarisedimenticolaceae bacterium]|nr:PilZ domain-containing protein [Candidatus Polarisedimenticolaceae bacterium]
MTVRGPAGWCAVCGVQHLGVRRCDGELLATGPERHGQRVTVQTSARTETYGVLIAEAGDHWRARIVTYPGMLWCVPDARTTLKFVGRSAQDVERQAVAFIEEHCRTRGHRVIEQPAAVAPVRVAGEAAHEQSPRVSREARQPGIVPVRYGVERPTEEGSTHDLSPGGLFVAGKPFAVGQTLKLVVQLDSYSIPLQATVQWIREAEEAGRPAGMGLRLQGVPATIYLDYVRRLAGEPAPEAT